jgi:ABC-type lipoprotein release transport system permease subunit
MFPFTEQGFAILALALMRMISGFLHCVPSYVPVTFCGILLILWGVTLAACYMPARKASRLDPLVGLRENR